MNPLEQARRTYEKELDKLSGYVQKSYKARIKWVKSGHTMKVIEAEIGIALAGGRLDLVENLMKRREDLNLIQKEIQRLDYEQRFGSSVEDAPLPEDSSELLETDSTPFLTEGGERLAPNANQ